MRLQGKMLAAGVACTMAVAALIVPSATAAKPTITIWIQPSKVAALEAIASDYKAANIVVVEQAGDTRDLLQTVAEEDAPDIFEGAHDWSGELASNGSAKAISLPGPVAAQFLKKDLDAFKYDGSLLGVPMLHESIAFLMNTKIAGKTCPATLDNAVSRVESKLEKGKINTIIQVGGSNAYMWYPMMSGLGGAFFKQKANGEYTTQTLVDKTADTKKKANIIKGWNASGLFDHSAGNGSIAGPFSKGKAAYYITGPWESNGVRDLAAPMDIKLCAFPTIIPGIKSVPFSGVRGFYLSKFAQTHGVKAAAKDFMITYLTTAKVQKKFCKLDGCNPSNKNAGVSPNPFTAQFLVSYADAVPMPNIPEMAAIWGNVAAAWDASMAEEDSTNPKVAWANAADNIRSAISGG
jgi:arabinogalactan oligomer/maltooligosaccharide transport system substrate-binding protein